MREFKYGLLFLSILLIGCQGLQTIAPKDRIALLQGGGTLWILGVKRCRFKI